MALWPNSYLTLLDPGSILRPSFNCIKPALHCIRSSCSSITFLCTTSSDIGMPALGLSSTLMTDCRCMIHWKIIIWFCLVLAGVSAAQSLGDALGNSIFSPIQCGQRHLWFHYPGILFISSEVISGYSIKVDISYMRLLFISFVLGFWLWIFQPCDHPPYLFQTHPMKDAIALLWILFR